MGYTVYRELGGTSTVKFGTAVYREYRPSLVGNLVLMTLNDVQPSPSRTGVEMNADSDKCRSGRQSSVVWYL